jgi:aminoglycoside-2''-adenylyltransferase
VIPEVSEPALPPDGVPFEEFIWEPWSPSEVVQRLEGVDAPWAFAGGWALDLFRGEVTREHEDVEIAVPAGAFHLIRDALAGYEFDVVGAARRWPLSDKHAFEVIHQTWARDPVTGTYRLDVFREPHDGDTWICRRDRGIRRPYAELLRRTPEGLPYVAPEVVLLFKARLMRPKDEMDFAGTLPLLDEPSRSWLLDSLARVHPGHAWIDRISGAPPRA